jgi:signal transduction histidine kinase
VSLRARESLHWRLPIVAAAVVVAGLTAFGALSYREMRASLLRAGGLRAQAAADQVAIMLAQSAAQRIGGLARAAASPAVRAFVAAPSRSAGRDVRRALAALDQPGEQSLQIWSAGGAQLLRIDRGRPPDGASGVIDLPPPRGPGLRLFDRPPRLITEMVVPVPGDDGATAGYLLMARTNATAASAEPLQRLVGPNASVEGGVPGGVWTNLAVVVPPPPSMPHGRGVSAYTDRAGVRRLGAAAAVPGTGWQTWVSFPEAALTAPATELARQLIGIGVVIALLAAVAARLLTQRITRPLVELGAAAAAVTAGDLSQVVDVRRRDEIGQLGHAFNAMIDRVRRSQEELEARVEERTRDLESFSYSVSHDLRAPLRHVVGFSELLQRHAGAAMDEVGRRYLRTIVASATRMGRLIDELLAFSRTGRAPLNTRRVRLGDVVADAQREVAGPASGQPPVWTVGPLPEVDGDPALLRQAFVNLLSNAIKYSSGREEPRVEVGAAPSGNGDAIVYVRDNGVGFDPQYAHKLFGVFQRLHSSDEFEGTGIGLANVRRIVERHGGRVWAESTLGHGATFYLSLPAKDGVA